MNNEPKIVIKYLVNYEINITGTIDEAQSDMSEISTDDKIIGKKGLHLNGGHYDEVKGEDVGTLLNGEYTLYKSEKKYKGILGTEMSNDDYGFDTPQYITVSLTDTNNKLKSLLIYFDNVAGEIATRLRFSNEPTKIYQNDKYVFMHSFGEDSDINSVTVYFDKWSKRNATIKLLKVKTGYTALYDPYTIKSMFYTRDKYSSIEDLKFGVSQQQATFEIFDADGVIKELYDTNLMFKNIEVYVYIDDVLDGTYVIDTKQSDNTIDYWTFDCKDLVSVGLSENIPVMNIELDADGVPIPKTIKQMIEYAVGGKANIIYEDNELISELENLVIKNPYVKYGQTREEFLVKCCQIALLRMYSDTYGNLLISRGV